MLSQHSPYFTPLAFDSWDGHGIVGCRLVPHPCDNGSFGPLFDWDALCSSNSPTSNWRGMFCDGLRHLLRQVSVDGMEIEVCHDRTKEILNVLGLNFLSLPNACFFAFDV